MKFMKKKFLMLFFMIMCFAALLSGCKKNISKSGFYFDTVISITLYEDKYDSYLEGCFQLADKYEKLFSATKPDSDISKINAAKGAPVAVSQETLDLLQKGIYYSDISNGGFDITIGALTSLWGFGHGEEKVPEQASIDTALSTIDYHNVIIEGDNVRLSDPNTQIDLGAIAKGYIADRMKEYLNENGVTSGLINLGGNVLGIGPKEDGSAYTIGVQKPFDKEGAALMAIDVKDETVVSSGTYERNFTEDGKLYHHLLNPKTGYPYENGLVGVTIICKNSVDGDGLSTTCFSLGLDAGMKLIESLKDTEAVFITEDNQIHCSSGMGKTIPYKLVQP